MSYSLSHQLKNGGLRMQQAWQLGDVSASATAAVKSNIDCAEAAVTGISYIDGPIVKCCEKLKKGSGSAGDKAKGVALCIKDGVAVGLGTAAGTATGAAACTATGVLAPVAPLCGMIGGVIGGWLGSRIAGYSTAGTVAFVAGTAICGPACGLLLGELTEFFSDTLGPIISGIFDPGAAARRERQRREAEWRAWEGSEKAMREAEAQTISAWTDSVNRIWELYEKAFPTPTARADAAKGLGLNAAYPSIVAAMIAIGVQYEKLPDETILRYQADGAYGCEQYGKQKNGSYGPVSGLCPPFWWQRFQREMSYQKTGNAQQVAEKIVVQINDFFKQLQFAETVLSARIATYATMQAAAGLAKRDDDVNGFMVSAQKAAARAVAAALKAESTSSPSVSEAEYQRARLALVSASKAVVAIQTSAALYKIVAGDRLVKAQAALATTRDAVARAEAAHKKNLTVRNVIVAGGAATLVVGALWFLKGSP